MRQVRILQFSLVQGLESCVQILMAAVGQVVEVVAGEAPDQALLRPASAATDDENPLSSQQRVLQRSVELLVGVEGQIQTRFEQIRQEVRLCLNALRIGKR